MAEYKGYSGKTYRTQDTPFAGGGEGSIYEIVGTSDYVAKIFKQDKRTMERERKLSIMVSNRPSAQEQYAWPMDVLYEKGRFAGYLMPRISGKEKLRNIYVYDNRRGKPWSLFVAIAKNLAAAVHNVHGINQVIGDLNPENILVNPRNGMVTLVDTDSYHISDSDRTYRCMVGMAEFVAPELQGIHFPSAPLPTFTKESDRFALAVLIFALLMNGAHPFACRVLSGSASKFQPIDNIKSGWCAFFRDSCPGNMEIPGYAPDMSALPETIQRLFRRAFVAGNRTPSMRPAAEEWYYALEQLENHLKKCSKGHLYYYGAKECPWCKVNAQMRNITQSSFQGKGISQQGGGFSTAIPPHFTPGNYHYTPSPNTTVTQAQVQRKGYVGWIVAGMVILALIGMVKGCTSEMRYERVKNAFEQDRIEQAGTQKNATLISTDTTEEVNENTLQVDNVDIGETITISEEPVISYTGAISDSNESDIYTYTAPRDGIYRFDLNDVQADVSFQLTVWDANGNCLIDDYSGGSDTTLQAGGTYEIQISEYRGSSDYTLTIGVQKETKDISAASFIHDQITFADQRNTYLFTAPRSGRYRFDLTEVNTNTIFYLTLQDSLDHMLMDTYSEGAYVDLEEGETYWLTVEQYREFGSYIMRVYCPKPARDITDYGKVNDSIQYDSQENKYLFTVPVDEEYCFELTDVTAEVTLHMTLYDSLDYVLMDSYSEKSYVDLEAGQTYQLQVEQYRGQGSYCLNFKISNLDNGIED